MKKDSKIRLALIVGLILSMMLFAVHTWHERNPLQARAKEFLARPVPQMFQTNEIGGFGVGPNRTVLSDSRSIIEQYAVNGQIRQTSAIAAQMALSNFEISFCSNAAKTDKAALNYIEECKEIRDAVWRMGGRQVIENLIE